MSVGQTKASVSSSEYLEWIHFLDKKDTNTEKIEHYLAALTAEVRKSYVKHPQKVRVKDFLFKFVKKAEKIKKDLSIAERTSRAKLFWGALLGSPQKPKKTKRN